MLLSLNLRVNVLPQLGVKCRRITSPLAGLSSVELSWGFSHPPGPVSWVKIAETHWPKSLLISRKVSDTHSSLPGNGVESHGGEVENSGRW